MRLESAFEKIVEMFFAILHNELLRDLIEKV